MFIAAVDWSMEVVELCKKYSKDGVVAIDLAGDESLDCKSYPGHKRAFEVRNHTSFIWAARNLKNVSDCIFLSGSSSERLHLSLLGLLRNCLHRILRIWPNIHDNRMSYQHIILSRSSFSLSSLPSKNKSLCLYKVLYMYKSNITVNLWLVDVFKAFKRFNCTLLAWKLLYNP